MATTNDLKNGMVLNLDGQLWQVIWFQHHKPGKGGAVVRSKLKNVESGKTVDKKARGAVSRFVVLDDVGRPRVLADPSIDDLRAAYDVLVSGR